ncbi:DUF6036 family nucleotidyltransferase [Thermofilum pendens]|uniref:DUF6036 family nucleotidyltransferase n=1 Tax=Thermofilum pendens TaxID=2269 RepID=UPI000699BE41|nr:DUF6036 family nucleotidyltransferase [Thermofilum pendens]
MDVVRLMVSVARALRRADLPYAVVGGLACILMGVRRVTEDVDVVVLVRAREDVEKLVRELRSEGIELPSSDALKALQNRGLVAALVGPLRVDIRYASTWLDFETIRHAVEVNIRGEPVRIASLEDVVAAKLTVLRTLRDVEDAVQLMVQYRDRIDWERLRRIVGGSPLEVVKQLLDAIEGELGGDEVVRRRINDVRSLLTKLGR